MLVVDYRLASEHPFPAAVEDAALVYRHLLSSGFAPASIAFAGDSAGGGLVFGSLVKLRDDGAPMPAAACSFSPWTDLAITGRTVTTNRDADPMVRAEALHSTAAWYLGSTSATSPYASPFYADVQGLPPTLLHVGSTEVLLDDSQRLAEKMKAARVDVDLRVWPDMQHVLQGFALFLPEARSAIADAGWFLDARMLSVGASGFKGPLSGSVVDPARHHVDHAIGRRREAWTRIAPSMVIARSHSPSGEGHRDDGVERAQLGGKREPADIDFAVWRDRQGDAPVDEERRVATRSIAQAPISPQPISSQVEGRAPNHPGWPRLRSKLYINPASMTNLDEGSTHCQDGVGAQSF